jgi:hypothetical protein
MTLPVVFTANGPSGYNLTNSLRFRSSASAYLNRTPASAGNRQTWTWSGWVKRGILGTYQQIFGAYIGSGTTDTNYFEIVFLTDLISITGYSTVYRRSTAVYRDPSAWYHIIVAVDTTQATASNRLKVYVNSSEVTAFGTSNNPTQNTNLGINGAYPHGIGAIPANASYFDGYQTEVNFIDGQALTPSSFGETSSTTGVWIPKKYTGTYGTNGFYLPFTDNSALTTSSNVGLGKDFSGNANYWTTNNISITSGSTYDSMTDVPTLTSTTAANYCTLNPLDVTNTGTRTIQAGNLDINTSSGAGGARSTFQLPTTGKWYFEGQYVSGTWTGNKGFGIGTSTSDISGSVVPTGCVTYNVNGNKTTGGAYSAYGSSYTTTDTVGIAVDQDAGTVTFYKNNTSQGAITHGLSTSNLFALFVDPSATASVQALNFGQRPFTYTPPSGFVRLNTFNLTTPTIGATASTTANKYMNVVTYTGTGSSLSVTGVGFQPDWTWIKGRSGATDHGLYDAVRGVQKQLESNTTDSETTETTGLTAFGSDGFTVGALAQLNTSSATYVGWNWKANGAGSTNTAGSITSTVSANTSAGFSVVTYTGTGSNATVGHGLGVAPSMYIVKSRSLGTNWPTYHIGLTSASYRLFLDLTNAQGADLAWNNTAPTSTVFSIGPTGYSVNNSGATYVAYCFAPIAGYSAFGSYTGNGSATAGPFVYLGFRPRFVMVKRTDTTGNWNITDTAINPYNNTTGALRPNTAETESTVGTVYVQPVSNGFYISNNSTETNASSGTYIYACFAESPFKYANAR